MGVYSGYNHANPGHDRGLAPNNGGNLTNDYRMLWARHGSGKPRGAADTFRFNAGFLDGHVETLGDLEGADPKLWLPKGTTIAQGISSNSEVWQDVATKYGKGSSGVYVAP